MASFYLTFVAVLIAGLGARDQSLIAGLTLAQGQRKALLAVGLFAACATAAFAAWAGTEIAPMLSPRARAFFAAMALCFAGIESMVLVPRATPREPTHSLGAALLALVALQAVDAARFLVFAIAIARHAPFPAGLAGAIGGCALVYAAWSLPHWVRGIWLRRARRGVGAVLLLTGFVIGVRTLELV
ncbi:MAG: hypothetical protein M0R03_04025 [Novosphingobium sp.]|nr:hypothetical protein [Novosphingobium sp.]